MCDSRSLCRRNDAQVTRKILVTTIIVERITQSACVDVWGATPAANKAVRISGATQSRLPFLWGDVLAIVGFATHYAVISVAFDVRDSPCSSLPQTL
jgi:hypothetical protein